MMLGNSRVKVGSCRMSVLSTKCLEVGGDLGLSQALFLTTTLDKRLDASNPQSPYLQNGNGSVVGSK